MKILGAALAAAFLTLSVAGCATTPPPAPVAYPDPPPKKPYDAKTQLESGRKY